MDVSAQRLGKRIQIVGRCSPIVGNFKFGRHGHKRGYRMGGPVASLEPPPATGGWGDADGCRFNEELGGWFLPHTQLNPNAMPRDGAITFSDLIGKTEVLRVTCAKCGRDGHYIAARLIRKRGRDAKVIDWLDELTADCPKKLARNMNDPCGARCPQLPKVL